MGQVAGGAGITIYGDWGTLSAALSLRCCTGAAARRGGALGGTGRGGRGELVRAEVLRVMSYEDLLFGGGTTEVAMEPPGTPHEPRLCPPGCAAEQWDEPKLTALSPAQQTRWLSTLSSVPALGRDRMASWRAAATDPRPRSPAPMTRRQSLIMQPPRSTATTAAETYRMSCVSSAQFALTMTSVQSASASVWSSAATRTTTHTASQKP